VDWKTGCCCYDVEVKFNNMVDWYSIVGACLDITHVLVLPLLLEGTNNYKKMIKIASCLVYPGAMVQTRIMQYRFQNFL